MLPDYLRSNELTYLGNKIFLDRYAKKDRREGTLAKGDIVVVCTNVETKQREIGEIQSTTVDTVTAKLLLEDPKESKVITVPLEQVDKPLELRPEQMFDRVAKALAQGEKGTENIARAEKDFRDLLEHWKFVPAGRILTGAGIHKEVPLTMFNCYVIPSPYDSRGGILQTASHLAELFSRGGGVGVNLSTLRPRYMRVKGVNGRSSGAVSWATLYSQITGLIEQGGCVAGDTLVTTSLGNLPIRELAGEQPFVYSRDPLTYTPGFHSSSWVKQTGTNEPLYKLTTTKGFPVRSTKNHGVLCFDGIFKELGDLKKGDWLYNNHQVADVVPDGHGDVYDLEVPHMGNFNVVPNAEYNPDEGIILHNSRRGALMLVLEDWHPDLLEFINAKRDPEVEKLRTLLADLEEKGLQEQADQVKELIIKWPSAIAHANLSIGISDAFIEAVEKDLSWDLVFPDTTHPDYDEKWDGNIQKWREQEYPVKIVKTCKAREIWDQIIDSAWASGEPGMVFLDTSNHMSTSGWLEVIKCCNPCGEQMLPPWAVCDLGALNLPRFLVKDQSTGEVTMDWGAYKDAIHSAVAFLDDVIDVTPYFFEENEKKAKLERRIGLSPAMGLAEALICMKIPYGSQESLDFIEKLGKVAATAALWASICRAKMYGACPALQEQENRAKFLRTPFIQRILKEAPELSQYIIDYGVRNITQLTCAPTGTIGNLVATSTGIEPYYAFEYSITTNMGTDTKKERIYEHWIQENPGEPKPDYFVCATELDVNKHVRVQAALQKWIDSSISKTNNLPANATKEQVAQTYKLMWSLGCKGGTVFRDGSRGKQVLVEKKDQNETKKSTKEQKGSTKVPKDLVLPIPEGRRPASVYSVSTPGGKLHTVFTEHPETGKPFDSFLHVGKAGSDLHSFTETIGRLVSLLMRIQSPIPQHKRLELIKEQLANIGGSLPIGFGVDKVLSVPDGIAKVLQQHLDYLENPDKAAECSEIPEEPHEDTKANLCPECGSFALVYAEGCENCINCGYSRC